MRACLCVCTCLYVHQCLCFTVCVCSEQYRHSHCARSVSSEWAECHPSINVDHFQNDKRLTIDIPRLHLALILLLYRSNIDRVVTKHHHGASLAAILLTRWQPQRSKTRSSVTRLRFCTLQILRHLASFLYRFQACSPRCCRVQDLCWCVPRYPDTS